MNRQKGFTLAELLIALAILGTIATFTIPKVLQSSNNSQATAIAKDVAGMIAGAYQAYQLENTGGAATTASNIAAYMNYVKLSTANDGLCSSRSLGGTTDPCIQLHNGGVIHYYTANSFGGTTNSHTLVFNIDPDGNKTGFSTATLVLFYNGRLTTGAQAGTITTAGIGATTSYMTTDPAYIQNWN